jgi:hypothetical protein
VFEAFTKYAAKLPLLEEMAIVHEDKAIIRSLLTQAGPNLVPGEFILKGYQIKPGDLDAWCPPYPYERDERQIVH